MFLLNFTNLKKYLNFTLLLILTTKVSLAEVNTPSYLYKEYEGLSEKEHALLLDVGDDLRCPTCTGLSILQSDALFAVQIRKAAIEEIKKGRSKQEILDFFTERYGLWILRAPPLEGSHLLIWFLPVLITLLSGTFLWSILWKRRKSYKTSIKSRQHILLDMQEKLNKKRNAKA